MAQLHPTLGFPAHEFDVLAVQMFGAYYRRSAIIFFHPFVHNEASLAELLSHRRTGVRHRMLNVWPVNVLGSHIEVGLNGSGGILWIADNEPADHIHAVTVQNVNGFQRGISRGNSTGFLRVLGTGSQELKILFVHVLDAEEHVAKPGPSHERRQLGAVIGDSRRHSLHIIIEMVQAVPNDRLAQAFKSLDVQGNIVVYEKYRARAMALRISYILKHAFERELVKIASSHFDNRTKAAIESATS